MKKRRQRILDASRTTILSFLFHHLVLLCCLLFFLPSQAVSEALQRKDLKRPPILRTIPPTEFRCLGRPAGYYADVEVGCQVYHMCDTQEKQFSYLCPDLTLFNQKYMVCDHWYAVDCSQTEDFYHLNEKIGKVPKKKSISQRGREVKKKFAKKRTSSKSNFPSFRQIFTPESFISSLSNASANANPSIQNKIQTRFPTNQFVLSPFVIPTTKKRNSLNSPLSTAKPFVLPKQELHFTTERSNFIQKQGFTAKPSFSSVTRFPPRTSSPENGLQVKARASGRKVKFGSSSSNTNLFGTTRVKNRHFNAPVTKSKPSFFQAPEIKIPSRLFELPAFDEPFIFPNSIESEDSEERETPTFFSPNAALVPPNFSDPPSSKPTSEFNIDTVLVPPIRGPVVLRGDNQELRTPLSLNRSFFSTKTSFPFFGNQQSSPIEKKFNNLSSNKQFFISPSGEQSRPSTSAPPRFPPKSIQGHHMTMTFPSSSTFMRRRRPLRANPSCPRCHPAFLKPNSCHPCVIIK